MRIPSLRERMSAEYQSRLKSAKRVVKVCDIFHIGKRLKVYQESMEIIERDELIDIGLKPDERIHKGLYGEEIKVKMDIDPALYYELPEEDVLKIQKDFDKILGERVGEILREKWGK